VLDHPFPLILFTFSFLLKISVPFLREWIDTCMLLCRSLPALKYQNRTAKLQVHTSDGTLLQIKMLMSNIDDLTE
jgi:hypothetical protein